MDSCTTQSPSSSFLSRFPPARQRAIRYYMDLGESVFRFGKCNLPGGQAQLTPKVLTARNNRGPRTTRTSKILCNKISINRLGRRKASEAPRWVENNNLEARRRQKRYSRDSGSCVSMRCHIERGVANDHVGAWGSERGLSDVEQLLRLRHTCDMGEGARAQADAARPCVRGSSRALKGES